jgi:hypothetical protein
VGLHHVKEEAKAPSRDDTKGGLKQFDHRDHGGLPE